MTIGKAMNDNELFTLCKQLYGKKCAGRSGSTLTLALHEAGEL